MENYRLYIRIRHRVLLLLSMLFMAGANGYACRQDSLRSGNDTEAAMAQTVTTCEAEVTDTSAVKFKVTGFRVLSNDVSAFITPVRDLNNEACALLKVVARQDFAFSSPLGIVKRKDEVGEIWLYLPKGTRRITIKHPRWGVLRNYRLPLALESHVAYEMTISEPRIPMAYEHDTVILTKTIVDTVAVKRKRPRLPMTFHALLPYPCIKTGPHGASCSPPCAATACSSTYPVTSALLGIPALHAMKKVILTIAARCPTTREKHGTQTGRLRLEPYTGCAVR